MIELRPYQKEAIDRLKTGKILCGGVGSGKSITSLSYYFEKVCGGHIDGCEYEKMKQPKDLYIITTAMKRDKFEWDKELAHFLLSTNPEVCAYDIKVVIDSWNNIKKYTDAVGAFFIFDEDKVIGNGAWVKAFYKIAAKNDWIILSATPGDTWMDYIPVFVANGFYKNRTEFLTTHAVWNRYSKYPKVDKYIGTGLLLKYRRMILVDMEDLRETEEIHIYPDVSYDKVAYKDVMKRRWNPYTDRPIKNATELCYTLRKVVNSDPSRVNLVKSSLMDHPKIILFYNFDYELDILRNTDFGDEVQVAEWNGHKHEPIPDSDSWLYLVQYTAGAEGWECTLTDTIIFFSQNYSYKVMVQAAGRINRVNTPYKNLFYYHYKSQANIDLAIYSALSKKKKFNERNFADFWDSQE
jgi:hypothetical protein